MQKIIILENLEFLALKIQKILMEHGYEEISIINTSNKFSTNRKKILAEASFIIVDLDNLTYDPIELIKENERDIPIVFMSETGEFDKIKQIIEAGGKDFLLKPFETELLLSKISNSFLENNSINENIKEKEIFPKTKIVLEWNKGFEIGVNQIDNEHKSIIDNYEIFYDKIGAGEGLNYYPELLLFLQNYIDTHFGNEEKLQKQVGYSECDKHKIMHEEFTKTIKKYMEKQEVKGADYRDLVAISLYMKDWLIHHILIEDKKIGDFIKKNKVDVT